MINTVKWHIPSESKAQIANDAQLDDFPPLIICLFNAKQLEGTP